MLAKLLEVKPNLTDKHRQLLSAFYVLDRERDRVGQMAWPINIKQRAILDYISINSSHGYESDILINILTELDEYHLQMYAKKQKAEAKKRG